MSPELHRRFTRPVAAVVFAVATLALVCTPAATGGWAVGSLDAVPEATAGETVEVGFTILQHGVSPVDLTDGVGIEFVRSDGTVDFFAGTSDGAIGHYTASVTFPETDGQYAWNIRMGWFGSQDLGMLDVLPADRARTSTLSWPTVRWATLALAAVLAAIAIGDVAASRRRERVTTS